MGASARDISFFTVVFVVRYERRHVFDISSVVVPSPFDLSRERLKVSIKRSAHHWIISGRMVT